VKRFHFDEDSLVDVNLKLNIINATENSLTLTWESVEHAEGFNIVSSAPIKEGPYPNSVQSFNVSNGKNELISKFHLILRNFFNILFILYLLLVTKLSPGVRYTINVTPYNKRYIGMKYIISAKTEGKN
jgi:hypothetical protein